ncbi:hypothetical protein CJU90_6617 [Yarrowia sp. C11]|nr:hypothetical protein CJU90_6617 [Yarrowia sp. C11]KAG5358728.1 hypothetical protein CKK34_4994 [Yarrowia sp. E02]
MKFSRALLVSMVQANLTWAQTALVSPITSMVAHLAQDPSTNMGYKWDTFEASMEFAFDEDVIPTIRGGDYFQFQLHGDSLSGDQEKLFHVTVSDDDNYIFTATATTFFDSPFTLGPGTFSVEFVLQQSSDEGEYSIVLDGFPSSVVLEDYKQPHIGVWDDTEKVAFAWERRGEWILPTINAFVPQEHEHIRPLSYWHRFETTGFSFIPNASNEFGLVDIRYINADGSDTDLWGSPVLADMAPPDNSFSEGDTMFTNLDWEKMPDLDFDTTDGMIVTAQGKMSGNHPQACFLYTGNYRLDGGYSYLCIAQGRGKYGLPNGYGLAEAYHLPETSSSAAPSSTAESSAESSSEPTSTAESSAEPTSTVEPTGTSSSEPSSSAVSSSEPTSDASVSTKTVPGPTAGTETRILTNGETVVQVTRGPVSTNTVTGSVAGTELLTNSDGDYFEQVTTVPQSGVTNSTVTVTSCATTKTVTGVVPGTTTITLSNGELCEVVTVAGLTTVTNSVLATKTVTVCNTSDGVSETVTNSAVTVGGTVTEYITVPKETTVVVVDCDGECESGETESVNTESGKTEGSTEIVKTAPTVTGKTGSTESGSTKCTTGNCENGTESGKGPTESGNVESENKPAESAQPEGATESGKTESGKTEGSTETENKPTKSSPATPNTSGSTEAESPVSSESAPGSDSAESSPGAESAESPESAPGSSDTPVKSIPSSNVTTPVESIPSSNVTTPVEIVPQAPADGETPLQANGAIQLTVGALAAFPLLAILA